MTPTEMLTTAQQLLERSDAKTVGLWPRAAALLARQALEQTLDTYWQARGLDLTRQPTQAQLICLTELLNDRPLALALRYSWAALSRACHTHAYELAPTMAELRQSLDTALLAAKRLHPGLEPSALIQ